MLSYFFLFLSMSSIFKTLHNVETYWDPSFPASSAIRCGCNLQFSWLQSLWPRLNYLLREKYYGRRLKSFSLNKKNLWWLLTGDIVISLKFSKIFSIVTVKDLMLRNRKSRTKYLGLICARPITAHYWSIYRHLCRRFRKKEILDGNDRV